MRSQFGFRGATVHECPRRCGAARQLRPLKCVAAAMQADWLRDVAPATQRPEARLDLGGRRLTRCSIARQARGALSAARLRATARFFADCCRAVACLLAPDEQGLRVARVSSRYEGQCAETPTEPAWIASSRAATLVAPSRRSAAERHAAQAARATPSRAGAAEDREPSPSHVAAAAVHSNTLPALRTRRDASSAAAIHAAPACVPVRGSPVRLRAAPPAIAARQPTRRALRVLRACVTRRARDGCRRRRTAGGALVEAGGLVRRAAARGVRRTSNLLGDRRDAAARCGARARSRPWNADAHGDADLRTRDGGGAQVREMILPRSSSAARGPAARPHTLAAAAALSTNARRHPQSRREAEA